MSLQDISNHGTLQIPFFCLSGMSLLPMEYKANEDDLILNIWHSM